MATTGTGWAFDLGNGSTGEFPSPRWGEGGPTPDGVKKPKDNFLHKAALPIPADFTKKKKGLKLSLAPVQELRFTASLLSLPTVWNTGYRRF